MKSWATANGYKITQVLSGRSNVFLISGDGKLILIDTSPDRKWFALDRRLKELHIVHIDYLVLTHTHFDHAANSFRIKMKYGAKVIVHRLEAEYLTGGKNSLPSGTNIVTRFLSTLLMKRITTLLNYEPCRYDILIDSELNLKESGINASVIHTPGHSIGSISIIVDNEIAVVGDAMFGISRWSVFPPFADDTVQLIRSWALLLDTGCNLFLPGHGTANSRDLLVNDYNKRK